MATAPVDIPVKVKGLSDLQKLERRMEAIEKDYAKVAVTAPKAANQIKRFGDQARKTESKVGGLTKSLRGFLTVAALATGTKFVFGKTAELETQTRSLKVLTGELETAQKIVSQLQQFASVTPFTSSELIESAKRLKAFGVDTEKLVDTTQRLADVSGATGAKLNEVATAYGQIQAKGRLQGEELLQLQERGIGLQDELQKMYGLTGEEFSDALSKGKFSAEAVEVALQRLTTTGGKYADGAISQSDTLAGRLSTLQDNIQLLATNVGRILTPLFKWVINSSIDAINYINQLASQAQRIQGFGISDQQRDSYWKQAGEEAEELIRLRGQLDALGNPDSKAFTMLRNERFSDLLEGYGYKNGMIQVEIEPVLDKSFKVPDLLGGNSQSGGGNTGGGSGVSAADTLQQQLKAGQELARQFEQRKALLLAENELQKSLLQNDFDRLDLEKQIKETAAESQQAALLAQAQEIAQIERKQAIAKFSEDALKQADGLISSTYKQIEADARRQELIADGINPALADSLVAIEQQFEPVKKILDEKILTLETTIEQLKAEGKVTKELEKQLELIRKRRGDLDKAEGAAKGNAKKDEPGKIQKYMDQLQADLTDTEGMIVSLAQTVETELASAMSSAITGLIDGTKTAEEAFADMFKNIGKAFIDMATEMIAKALIMKALGILSPGGGGGGSFAMGGSSTFSSPSSFDAVGAGLFSFAGGGYTGNGPRTGGLDGQGGYMAMVHPNETVVDHSPSMGRYAGPQNTGGFGSGGTFKLETTVINDVEYATVDQVKEMGAIATRDGAKQGQVRTMRTLQNSRSQRTKLGLNKR